MMEDNYNDGKQKKAETQMKSIEISEEKSEKN